MDEEHPDRMYARRELAGIGEQLDIESSTVQYAEQIFTNAREAGVHMGSISRFVTACLFAACKVGEEPVTEHEIIEVSRNELKWTTETYQNIATELGLEVTPRDPKPFIEDYATELDFNHEQLETALEISERAKPEVFGRGIAPSAFASAVIYITGLHLGNDLTQSDVSEVSGRSNVTIRNRYQDIIDVVDIDLKGRQGRNKRDEM